MAGKKASSEEVGELDKWGYFFFLSRFSCLWGDQKKEKEQARRFSKSDFSGKQRKHLSEQSAERRASP